MKLKTKINKSLSLFLLLIGFEASAITFILPVRNTEKLVAAYCKANLIDYHLIENDTKEFAN